MLREPPVDGDQAPLAASGVRGRVGGEALSLDFESASLLLALQEQVASGELSLANALRRICEVMMALVGCESAAIALRQGEEIEYIAGAGFAEMVVERSFPVEGTSLTAECYRSGHTLYSPDMLTDARACHTSTRLAAWRSAIVVPLIAGGERLGVLNVASVKVDGFRRWQVQLAELVAVAIRSTVARQLAVEQARAVAVERAALAERVEDLDQLVERVFHEAPLPMYLLEAVGEEAFRVASLNRAAADAMSISTDEARGRLTSEMPVGRAAQDAYLSGAKRVRGGEESARVEHSLVTPRGKRQFSGVIYPLRRPGKTERYCVMVEEVTERENLRERLVAADRQAALGTLASGVAHEVNNPLAFILSNLRYVEEELGQLSTNPDLLSAVTEAREGGERIQRIVKGMLHFARASDEMPATVDVREPVNDALQLARSQLRTVGQVETALEVAAPVMADGGKLTQVFLNLLINAVHAVEEKAAAQRRISVRAAVVEREVQVEVEDNGSGIAPEHLKRLFDPFFTTKGPDKGTGLGLSVCDGIVRGAGGRIEVRTKEGEGTTFKVVLPHVG